VERLRAEIDQQVQENLLKNQRDYYLQEKLRIIKQVARNSKINRGGASGGDDQTCP